MVLRVFNCLCLIAFLLTVSKSSTINKVQNQGGFIYPDEFENRYGNRNDGPKSTTLSPSGVTLVDRFLVNIPSSIPKCEAGYIYVEAVGGCRKKAKDFLL